MKTCRICGVDKEMSEFYKGWSYCKSCARAKQRRIWKENPELREKRLEYQRRQHRHRRPERRAYDRQWRSANKTRWGEALQAHFGDPTCEICGTPLRWFCCGVEGKNSVHWDHRNGYNEVPIPNYCFALKYTDERFKEFLSQDFGMLCNTCNSLLHTDPVLRERYVLGLVKYVLGVDLDARNGRP